MSTIRTKDGVKIVDNHGVPQRCIESLSMNVATSQLLAQSFETSLGVKNSIFY